MSCSIVKSLRWQRFLFCLCLATVFTFARTTPQAAAVPLQHGSDPFMNPDLVAEPAAPQAVTFTVKVVIEQIDATNNFDGSIGQADFFAVVRIDSHTQRTDAISDNNHIKPDWQISHDVLVPDLTRDLRTVTIDIRDSDGDPFCPDYDCHNQADLTADATRELNLTVDLSACAAIGASNQITGSVTGSCGATIFSAGTASDNTAEIRFRIEVDRPVNAPGVNIRCLHSPIWPQGGETIRIKAEVLDDDLGGEVFTDRIEIWFGSALADRIFGRSSLETSVTAPPSGSSFTYRCIARVGENTVSSGWHRVQVGAPPTGQAVPVLFTSERRAAIDIVFLPATGDYANELSNVFLQKVHNVIQNAYYGDKIFLDHQRQMNFWIGRDFGTANGYGNGTCVIAPGNWNSDYAFADAGLILHERALRDCAIPSRRIFSADSPSRVVLHETGHAVFGLADEYNDDIYYFQPNPFPNIYAGAAGCSSDIIDLQPYDIRLGLTSRTSANCRRIRGDWFKSEPDNDLMNNLGPIQGADLRRIDWVFNEICARNGCGTVVAATTNQPDEDIVPQFDYNDLEKVLFVDLKITNGTQTTMTEETGTLATASVAMIPPPASRFADPSMYSVVTHYSGTVTTASNLWFPTLQKGSFAPDPNCTGDVCRFVHDDDAFSSTASQSIPVLFDPNLDMLQIVRAGQSSEPNSNKVAEVDLKPAVRDYCRSNPTDSDCVGVDTTIPIAGLSATNDGPSPLGQPTALAANINEGENVTYNWNFGDGQTGSGATVQHRYAEAGTFTSTVTASNSQGSATALTIVIVQPAAPPQFNLYLPVVQR